MQRGWHDALRAAAVAAALSWCVPCGAMSPRPAPRFCTVIDGAKLPSPTGGAAALCKAIVDAAGPRMAGSRAEIVVRVLSSSMLVATLRNARGRPLPEMTFSISDKRLDRASLDDFAHEIADQLAKTG